MKTRAAILTVLLGVSGAPPVTAGISQGLAQAQADLRVWREFVDLLQGGSLPGKRILPYRDELRAPLGLKQAGPVSACGCGELFAACLRLLALGS